MFVFIVEKSSLFQRGNVDLKSLSLVTPGHVSSLGVPSNLKILKI
jgi:hypothetical protein